MAVSSPTEPEFTPKQGQYLAFIYTYELLNRQAPAQADFQHFFLVSPPAVHQMLATLEGRGWISRIPRKARSIRLLIPRESLPHLEPIKTSATGY